MIQAARHLAAFWPNQGADVIPTGKNQRSSARTQAPGAGGDLEAPGLWTWNFLARIIGVD